MRTEFFAEIEIPNLEVRDIVEKFSQCIFNIVFDQKYFSLEQVRLSRDFQRICDYLQIKNDQNYWKDFVKFIPDVKNILFRDAQTIDQNDPASYSLKEVILAYPGFYAIVIYRVSHFFYQRDLKLLARMISEHAHSKTGIDIHPGARIGESFFIDHGTGIVIGETTVIGSRVKMYQGVTLGGNSVQKKMQKIKRHPTIEDDVIIYANATILGGDIVIGEKSTIGANVWITESVPSNSLVLYRSEIEVIRKKT